MVTISTVDAICSLPLWRQSIGYIASIGMAVKMIAAFIRVGSSKINGNRIAAAIGMATSFNKAITDTTPIGPVSEDRVQTAPI